MRKKSDGVYMDRPLIRAFKTGAAATAQFSLGRATPIALPMILKK